MRLIIFALTFIVLSVSSIFAAEHIINIEGFAFDQASLTISAGDTVRFINMDSAPHTATADGGTFDTGRLSKGDDFVVTFSDAGRFSYFCAIHPSMKAAITVQ
jgi:plastocyanin